MIQGVLVFGKVHIHLFHFTVLSVLQALELIAMKNYFKVSLKKTSQFHEKAKLHYQNLVAIV